MPDETYIEELKELMRSPERIRNICTSAHIHHGKCIRGDSRILLADGSVKTAKELYTLAQQIGHKFEEKEDHMIYDVSKKNINVFSLNKDTGRLEKKPIELAWKLEGGKLIEIRLRNGFSIATTSEHKYTVFENGAFVDKPAAELKLGDTVVCVRTIKDGLSSLEIYEQFITASSDSPCSSLLTIPSQQYLEKFFNQDIMYQPISFISETFEDTVYDFTIPVHHNFVAEGIIIHNTALTDNLLAAAGFMSAKSAGDLEEGMATWQHKDEQERLMTVDAANVSMTHMFDGQKYLINLIDTPGHVDFGGNVTRAMRAIDGTIVLVCAVEGIMPQTETVIKQALRERIKPVLFINKVDRLINELKFTPEQIQQRFTKLILEFNRLVERMAEAEFAEKWKVNIQDGSVAFGSARENWALSLPYMQKKNVTFKDIVNQYAPEVTEEQRQEWVWKNAAVHDVLLDIVIKHLPNPIEAQKYRIPHIWKGDLESPLGKDLLSCNPDGKIAFVITRITIDPKSGRELAAGRLFSGTITEKSNLWLNQAKQYQRVAQVFMYRGIKPELIGEVRAGNVCALGGISGYAGETLTLEPDQAFEELKHIFEPVITKSIEPTKPQDLPKLVEVLRKVSKEDPSIKVAINPDTGENLMSGMGELHLEIIENRIITEKGLQIKTSPPIVLYRETVLKKSPELEGKSPNKHNKFYIYVEPLDDGIYQAIRDGKISEGRVKKNDDSLYRELEKLGVPVKEGRKIRDVFNGNTLVDDTRGIVHIGEVQELLNEGFEQVMKEGPLARESCAKLRVVVTDCKLHEDAIHRGPAQVLPAVRSAIKQAMVQAQAVIYEPMQVMLFEAPAEYMGAMSRLIQNKRGQLIEMNQEGDQLMAKAKLPVAESFGLASELRSATSGRGSQSLIDQLFEKLPSELQHKVIQQIRTRKGLKVDDLKEEGEDSA